jgi:hypothetical protein
MAVPPVPSSGPVSMDDLNLSFDRATGLQLSFNQAFSGIYGTYGQINRNTQAGANVYALGASGYNDLALDTFYGYYDIENTNWDYVFDLTNMGTGYDVDILVFLGPGFDNIFYSYVAGGTTDSSGAYVQTIVNGGGNLDLELIPYNTFNSVDVTVTDPDTGTTLYQVFNADLGDYSSATTLCTIAGYQRFQMTLVFF